MKLTQVAIKNAKPKEKPYKLADGEGMFLQVTPDGKKYWRLKYRYQGREKLLSLGVYPAVSLTDARAKRQEARKMLSEGKDPSRERQSSKTGSFVDLAKDWHAKNKAKWSASHSDMIWRRIETYLIPPFERRSASDITPLEVLSVIRAIEKKGTTEISHRILQHAAGIFRYGVVIGQLKSNPAADLSEALQSHKAKPRPTIKAKEIPAFLTALEGSGAHIQVRLALKVLLHTFVRPGELRHARKEELNFKAKEWIIPAEHMKMKTEHIVPLSNQAIKLFKQLVLLFEGPYLLPAIQAQKHPIMSENTLNKALVDMGYKNRLVAHGFRALASTTLNEMGFSPDVIEAQLAHVERNKVRAAYNRATYLPQRQEMMQKWSDYLETLPRRIS